jgi:hypothetical protein
MLNPLAFVNSLTILSGVFHLSTSRCVTRCVPIPAGLDRFGVAA